MSYAAEFADRHVRRHLGAAAMDLAAGWTATEHSGEVDPRFFAFVVATVAQHLEDSLSDCEIPELAAFLGEQVEV